MLITVSTVANAVGIALLFVEANSIAMPLFRMLMPVKTFVLLVDPDVARERLAGAGDRIEREGDEFLRTVDEAYRGLAAIFPQRIVALDGSRPATQLAEQVREHVRTL